VTALGLGVCLGGMASACSSAAPVSDRAVVVSQQHPIGCKVDSQAGASDSWIADEASQTAKAAIDKRLRERFEENTKVNRYVTLSNGLIGVALDHQAMQVVVVVDPERVNVAELQRELDQAAHPGDQPDPSEISVRVQSGCHPVADLIDAGQVIDSRTWHPRAESTGYSAGLDPHDSTYHVSIEGGRKDVGEALVKRLGSLVTVTHSSGGPVRDVVKP